MGQLTIQSCFPREVTIIPNIFLDDYMLDANGEFVKIYLYLLRATSNDNSSFSLSTIADTLNCTENDVFRALKYWSKAGVLDLAFDENRKLQGISLLPLDSKKESLLEENQIPIAAAAEEVPVAVSSPVEAAKVLDMTLTPSKVKKLKENEDIVQLLFIASQYLGKTLTPMETNRILYFYDELHFSADLIEYLIEYCVSKGTHSIRYIEKVALAWAEQSVTTVEMAKKETNTFHKNYFTILKALGIKGRNPIEAETAIMDTWLGKYSFTMDIIVEACTRTIMQTNQPSFQYTDGILSRWKEKGVKHLSDLDILDDKHKQAQTEREKSATKEKPSGSPAKNSFNNFHQREYDYSELEKQLLNK